MSDDLQAQQVVIDSFAALLIKRPNLLESIVTEELRMAWYSEVYKLGRKRVIQLGSQDNFEYEEQYIPFYLMDINARVILYLKDKCKFSFQEIIQVTNLKRYEIITLLNSSREQIYSSSKM